MKHHRSRRSGIVSWFLCALAAGATCAGAQPGSHDAPLDESLATHRLIEKEDGTFEILVNRGTPEEAAKYYSDLDRYLGAPTRTLDQMLAFCGYAGRLTADQAEVLPTETLNAIAGVSAAVHFAPKIVNVSLPPGRRGNEEFGWRKVIQLRAGGAAATKNIRYMWLLYNFVSKEATFPAGSRAGQIQVLLEDGRELGQITSGLPPFPVYFYVFESRQNGYQRRAFLQASFDAATRDPDEKYYVPNACAQCHGDTSRAMANVKINYLDTDHWYDRAGDQDFPGMERKSVLPDAGLPGTPQYLKVMGVFEGLNKEIQVQNERLPNPGFQAEAVKDWERQRERFEDRRPVPVADLQRGVFAGTSWPSGEPSVVLREQLSRSCFRCHSSFAFHILDFRAISERFSRAPRLIDGGFMPQDRRLTKEQRDELIQAFRCVENPNAPGCGK